MKTKTTQTTKLEKTTHNPTRAEVAILRLLHARNVIANYFASQGEAYRAVLPENDPEIKNPHYKQALKNMQADGMVEYVTTKTNQPTDTVHGYVLTKKGFLAYTNVVKFSNLHAKAY